MTNVLFIIIASAFLFSRRHWVRAAIIIGAISRRECNKACTQAFCPGKWKNYPVAKARDF